MVVGAIHGSGHPSSGNMYYIASVSIRGGVVRGRLTRFLKEIALKLT